MKTIIFALSLVLALPATAWDGYDYDNSSYVEIDKGNNVQRNRDIEIYDYSTGRYHDVEVESVRKRFRGTEVEVYDYDTNEYRILDMGE